jgi:hypothetical protein
MMGEAGGVDSLAEWGPWVDFCAGQTGNPVKFCAELGKLIKAEQQVEKPVAERFTDVTTVWKPLSIEEAAIFMGVDGVPPVDEVPPRMGGKGSAFGPVGTPAPDVAEQAADLEWSTYTVVGAPHMWDGDGVVPGDRILFHGAKTTRFEAEASLLGATPGYSIKGPCGNFLRVLASSSWAKDRIRVLDETPHSYTFGQQFMLKLEEITPPCTIFCSVLKVGFGRQVPEDVQVQPGVIRLM